MKIFAYYYPGFYDDTYRISKSEWNLMKQASPRHHSHYQPRVPLQGYYAQNNLEVCRQHIEWAQKYGIDGFMICYYWDFESGKPIMDEPLKYLIKAMEGTSFEFNLMWVLRLPHKELPLSDGNFGKYQNHPWFKKRIQKYSVDEAFHREINGFMKHPNYRKDSNGLPILQLYSVGELLEIHKQETKTILSSFSGCHLQGICGRTDSWISTAQSLGIQSLSTYVTLVDFNGSSIKLKHKNCVDEQVQVMDNIRQASDLPFYPSVSSGWDASPRGMFKKGFRNKKFPWAPLVVDANPKEFERNLKLAQKNCIEDDVDLHIASWNEWSEGHYVEPDIRFGFSFLEAINTLKVTKFVT